MYKRATHPPRWTCGEGRIGIRSMSAGIFDTLFAHLYMYFMQEHGRGRARCIETGKAFRQGRLERKWQAAG
jgi:hypothetical protein